MEKNSFTPRDSSVTVDKVLLLKGNLKNE